MANKLKYYKYKYVPEVDKLLSEVELSDLEISEIEKFDVDKKVYCHIVEDIYKFVKKIKLSTSDIAKIYGVGDRTIQLWLKELELNRKNSETREYEKSKIAKLNAIQGNIDKCLGFDEYKYCLYRFLNASGDVLYIGKCSKSIQSNGHGGTKEYFVKDRIQQHYSPSSKHLPKSLYLNTRKIEVCFPNVENNEELEYVESQIVSYYEREYMQCYYNLDLIPTNIITSDECEWMEYEVKTDLDIERLLIKYGYESVPQIEIVNERLKLLNWYINNKLKELENQNG